MYSLNKINNNEIDIYSKINEPDVHFLCKGYDVLKEKFFIYYEDLFYIRGIKKIFYFESFDEYWSFVNCFPNKLGDIYYRAFYYGYEFSDELVHKYNINRDSVKSFPKLEDNVSNFENLSYTNDEIIKYNNVEILRKKIYDKYIIKLIKADNINKLNRIMKKIDKLHRSSEIELDVYFF